MSGKFVVNVICFYVNRMACVWRFGVTFTYFFLHIYLLKLFAQYERELWRAHARSCACHQNFIDDNKIKPIQTRARERVWVKWRWTNVWWENMMSQLLTHQNHGGWRCVCVCLVLAMPNADSNIMLPNFSQSLKPFFESNISYWDEMRMNIAKHDVHVT